jgi:hypothetical protein
MIRPPKGSHEPEVKRQARDSAHSSDCEMNAQPREATGSPVFEKVLLQYHVLQHGTYCVVL